MNSRRHAINCLGSLCYRTGSKLQNYTHHVHEVLLDNLEVLLGFGRRLDGQSTSIKMACCILRALQLVLAEERVDPMHADRLMRVLPNFALLQADEPLAAYPYRLTADPRMGLTSSESEFSESDAVGSPRR
jgi:hypothetical protein